MKNDSQTCRKVPNNKKQQLIYFVFQKGQKIKHAAQLLNIKYAAAKIIIKHHRHNVILKNHSQLSTLQTKIVPIICKSNNTKIITKIGGKIIQESYYEFQLFQKET